MRSLCRLCYAVQLVSITLTKTKLIKIIQVFFKQYPHYYYRYKITIMIIFIRPKIVSGTVTDLDVSTQVKGKMCRVRMELISLA